MRLFQSLRPITVGRGREAAAAVVVSAVLLLLVWPVLFGDRTLFYRDLYLQYIGTGRLLHSGALFDSLTWDSILNGGQPLLGNPNRFVLYPSRVLYLLMDPVSAMNWEIALHLILGGTGAMLLARRLGISYGGAVITGLAFAMSGLSISITSHLGRLMAYHLAPWVLLAVHIGIAEGGRGSWRWRVLVPLLVALQWLTGTAELVAITGVMALGWAGASRIGTGRGISALACVVGLLVLGSAMAAIQILPAADMVGRSERPAYAEAGASVDWSLHPLRTPEFVVPGYCGPIDEYAGGLHYWGSGLFDRGFPLIVSLYLGATVVLLALMGWFTAGADRRWRSLRLVLTLCGAGAVIFAFGEHLPLVERAWAVLPGFNLVRFPVKMVLALGVPVALFAGRGCDEWLCASPTRSRRLGMAALAAAAAFLLAAGVVSDVRATPLLELLFPERAELARHGLGAQLVTVSILLAALSSTGFAATRVRRGLLRIIPVVVVAADLYLAAVSYLPMAPRSVLAETPELVHAVHHVLTEGRLFRDEDRGSVAGRVVEDRAWESADESIRDLSFSVASTFLVPMVLSDDIAALTSGRLAELATAAAGTPVDDALPLFRMAAVEAVLTRRRLAELELVRVGVFGSSAGPPLYLYRVTPVPQMAWWVESQVQARSAIEAYRLVTSAGFDPRVQVIRESGAPTTRMTTRGGGLGLLKSEVLGARVSAPADGFVALAVPWHPDLEVRVNGRAVRAERLNYAFTGFAIARGDHDVRVTFAPRSVLRGLLITGLSLTGWVALGIGLWWPWRRAPPHDSSSRASSPFST